MTSLSEYEAKIYEILDEETTSKYYIEYEGFKTNHLSQAIFALLKLATPVENVKDFLEWIKEEKLEDSSPFKEKEKGKSFPENVAQIVGTQSAYYHLKHYYSDLLDEKQVSLDTLIAEQFPKLSQGIAGAAFHGLIHLGYGYASGRRWFVSEGFAYLHDVYYSPTYDKPLDTTTLGTGSSDILDVVTMLHNDTALIKFMQDSAKSAKYQESLDNDFERRLHALFDAKGHALAEYVRMIRFPDGLDGKSLVREKVPELAKWVVDCCTIVYTIAETKNDFFLLHAVTSSWALKNILPILANCKDVLDSVHGYLMAVFAVYLVQNSPALDRTLLSENDGLTHSWEELVQKAIDHTDHEKEHMYKIVQVCKTMSEEYPGSSMESIYRLAAHNCVDSGFNFDE